MKTTCNKLNGTATANGQAVYVWQANNAGRGDDNVTIATVKAGTPRADRAAKQINVIASVRVCGWRGKLNLVADTLQTLGI